MSSDGESGTCRTRPVTATATRRPRPAFTLIELVVSMGVLVLMMTMAGTVYKLTLDSTGEATALTEINRSFRLLEQTLREDLANVNPARSIMVIQAKPINAYWRNEYAELDTGDGDPMTGYPHAPDAERDTVVFDVDKGAIPSLPRADILMFFTAQKTRSYTHPDIWSDLVQVVYGHAELGDLDKTGAWVGGAPTDFEDAPAVPAVGTPFPMPAEDWHLARRSVLLVDQAEAPWLDAYDPSWQNGNDVPDGVSDPVPGSPGVYLNRLTDGIVDLVVGTFNFDTEVATRTSLTQPQPPLDASWLRRSRLDTQPPVSQASRLGHYLLPRCASFKVEWALDLRKLVPFDAANPPPSYVVWLDPGSGIQTGAAFNYTPLSELAGLVADMGYTGTAVLNALGQISTSLTQRYAIVQGEPPRPVWFANDVPNGGSMGQPDRFFPVALRITVDVYDDSNRFERPLRHVMVLPVGSAL